MTARHRRHSFQLEVVPVFLARAASTALVQNRPNDPACAHLRRGPCSTPATSPRSPENRRSRYCDRRPSRRRQIRLFNLCTSPSPKPSSPENTPDSLAMAGKIFQYAQPAADDAGRRKSLLPAARGWAILAGRLAAEVPPRRGKFSPRRRSPRHRRRPRRRPDPPACPRGFARPALDRALHRDPAPSATPPSTPPPAARPRPVDQDPIKSRHRQPFPIPAAPPGHSRRRRHLRIAGQNRQRQDPRQLLPLPRHPQYSAWSRSLSPPVPPPLPGREDVAVSRPRLRCQTPPKIKSCPNPLINSPMGKSSRTSLPPEASAELKKQASTRLAANLPDFRLPTIEQRGECQKFRQQMDYPARVERPVDQQRRRVTDSRTRFRPLRPHPRHPARARDSPVSRSAPEPRSGLQIRSTPAGVAQINVISSRRD